MSSSTKEVRAYSAESDKGRSYAYQGLIAGCLMLAVWRGITSATTSIYADPVVNSIGITRTQFMFGAGSSVGIVNCLLSLFAYGFFTSKFGVKRMMLAGGIITTIGYLSLTFAQNFPMVLLGGVLYGTGACFNFSTSMSVIINSWFKKRQGTYVSLCLMVGSVTGIISATAFSIIISHFGWRVSYMIVTVMIVIATILIQILYKGDPQELGVKPMYADEAAAEAGASAKSEAVYEDGISYSRSLKSVKFYMLFATFFLVALLAYGPFSNMVMIANDLGFSSISGTFLSVALIASAVAQVPGGMIIDKFGSRWLVTIDLICVFISCMILRSHPSNAAMLYLVAILLGIGYNCMSAAPPIATRELLGSKDYAKKTAVIGAGSIAGSAVTQTLMAAFYDFGGGYDFGLMVIAVLCPIAVIASFIFTRRIKVKE